MGGLHEIKEGVTDLGELACHRGLGGFGAQISGRASDKSKYARAEHLLSSNSIKKITNWLVKIKEGVADLGELACHRGGFGAQISGRASDKSKRFQGNYYEDQEAAINFAEADLITQLCWNSVYRLNSYRRESE
ncbi:hypothetical protein ACOSQ4_015783 [Xanthoceras sorbifolium]